MQCPDCGRDHEVNEQKLKQTVALLRKTLVDNNVPAIEGILALQVAALAGAREHGIFMEAHVVDGRMLRERYTGFGAGTGAARSETVH